MSPTPSLLLTGLPSSILQASDLSKGQFNIATPLLHTFACFPAYSHLKLWHDIQAWP